MTRRTMMRRTAAGLLVPSLAASTVHGQARNPRRGNTPAIPPDPPPDPPDPGDLGTYPLLHISDFTRVGAFRAPLWATNPPDPYKIGQHCAFNPANGRVFLLGGGLPTAGGPNRYRMFECGVPSTLSGPNESVWGNLPATTMTQSEVEPTDGNWRSQFAFDSDYFKHGGFFVYNSRLIGSGLNSYDGTWSSSGGTPRYTHFARSTTLSNPTSFEGWKAIADAQWAGRAHGAMCLIPSYARSAFGGYPAIGSVTAAQIIGRTSWGPSVVAFDPDDIVGTTNGVIPGIPFMYYTDPHPLDSVTGQYTQNGWGFPDAFAPGVAGQYLVSPPYSSDLWTRATSIMSVLFPEGSRSIIFFCVQPTGDYAYGPGTSNSALHNTPSGMGLAGDGFPWIYDPYNQTEGEHGYPYRYQMYCYDALDILDAYGRGAPWDVQPYECGPFTLPIDTEATNSQSKGLGSIGYDPSTKRIFLPQLGAGPGLWTAAVWVLTHP